MRYDIVWSSFSQNPSIHERIRHRPLLTRARFAEPSSDHVVRLSPRLASLVTRVAGDSSAPTMTVRTVVVGVVSRVLLKIVRPVTCATAARGLTVQTVKRGRGHAR